MPMTPERWLQVQFNKKRRKGYSDNAELKPPPDEQVLDAVEPDEPFLLRIVVDSRKSYWLTDRRMLMQSDGGVSAMFQYDALRRVHWMFKEPLRRAFDSRKPDREIVKMKSEHGDRLELELSNGEIVLEHLGSAYNLVFQFLNFLIDTGRAAATT